MGMKATTVAPKRSVWRSKEARRVYWVVGLPAAILLFWYGYTVYHTLSNRPAAAVTATVPAAGQAPRVEIPGLSERADREGFRPEEVNKCQNIVAEYSTPKGWFYSTQTVRQLVGLPPDASQEQMNERCILFAKAVAAMENVSHHIRHVFVCGNSYFDIDSKNGFFIKADAQGRGAIQNTGRGEELMEIAAGRSSVLQTWQIYNVGDGCIIIGLSKSAIFRMSGKVEN